MRVKKAVIPAAGWGTRFLPVTKSQPKEMLPLGNKPVIQHSIEEAVACGVDLVVVVTSAGKSSIENYFDRSLELESVLLQKGDAEMVASLRGLSELADIVFVRQREQLGLGHAVLTASKVIGEEPFLLILPDDLFEQPASVLPQMVEVYQEFGGSVLSIKQVSDEEVSRYGIIASRQIAPRTHQVYDMVEKPSIADAPSHLAIMGRYLLTPEIFRKLNEVTRGVNGEYQLTDGLKMLLDNQSVYACEFDGARYDAGTPLGWLEASITIAMKDPDLGPGLRQFLYHNIAGMLGADLRHETVLTSAKTA